MEILPEGAVINAINKFIQDESGVTAIEYAMIAALIAVVIVAAVQALGLKVSDLFTSVTNAL
jgi:pilus assembly protein Flp/PilA